MMNQTPNGIGNDLQIIQYYMDILNCMPNIVYWVDVNCKLQGCNHNFVSLLGLTHMKDFNGTPYERMAERLPWGNERIESLKLNDMSVLFSGEPIYDAAEAPVHNKEGELTYYNVTRVPLCDTDKNTIGLVVIFIDITAQKEMEQRLHPTPTENKPAVDIMRLDTPLKILVVEDNSIAQNVERALLLELNCEVDIAESSEAALALFSPGKYAMVFMDISLGETSGYMVSKKMRKIEENTEDHVPIIALTSHKADVVKFDCHAYNMEGVLTKPLSSEQAMQLIKHYVYHEDIVVNGLSTV